MAFLIVGVSITEVLLVFAFLLVIMVTLLRKKQPKTLAVVLITAGILLIQLWAVTDSGPVLALALIYFAVGLTSWRSAKHPISQELWRN